MANLILGIEDIELGYLMKKGDKYLFCANGNEVNRAKLEYPIDMLMFDLNATGMKVYESIPYPFSSFLDSTHRGDLMESCGIEESDDDFTRLCKLSTLNIMRENFDIHLAK